MSLISELQKAKADLERKLEYVNGTISMLGGGPVKVVKRKLSAAGRAKISAAAKKMWAKKKKQG